MRSIARAPKYRRFCLRARRDLSNICYVDVRTVWRHVSRVVSGIRADTVTDEQPHDADRLGVSEIAVRVIGRLCVPSLGRNTIVTWNLCYVDVRSGGMACLVVSGIRAGTVFDEQAHVDRRRFSEIERSSFRERTTMRSTPWAPHYRRARRLLRRRLGGVVRLPCRQRHPG